MKRKSILMAIVAVLFAGAAWGQKIDWPSAHGSNVKASDTIYFCKRTDSQFPIELGYDVSGRRLHPSYGDWSLISKTSSSVQAADYVMVSGEAGTPGNGGAGNAYKTVGSGEGGLLFQYLSKDKQCGLLENEKYWVYVFILPEENNIVYRDTMYCKASAGIKATIDFKKTFKEYTDLYDKAGFTNLYKWGATNNGTAGVHEVAIDVPNIIPVQDTLILGPNNGKSKFLCGDTIIFKIDVIVKDSIALGPKRVGKCFDDTISLLKAMTLRELFGREGVPGTGYTETAILPWTSAEVSANRKLYTFTYNTCGTPATATIVDTLYLYKESPAPTNDWGKDTIVYCRLGNNPDIYALYGDAAMNYPLIPGAPPYLDESNSYWYDRDLGQTPFTFGPGAYGTKSKTSSIGIDPNVATPAHWAVWAKTNVIDVNDLRSNIGYHYLWRVDPGALDCFTHGGIADSGIMVLIVQDPAIAQDYTAQLCQSSYSTAGVFDLGAYSGLSVTWVGAPTITDGKITVANFQPGTYKYTYHVEPGCGSGGDGVFYVKVTNTVRTSSKEVKFCVEKLPATINVNDVLGVGVMDLKWTGLTAAEGFDETTGILDFSKYGAAHPNDVINGKEITLTTTNADKCGVASGTTVKINLVTAL
jgi:hypothetical protein